MVPPPPPGTGCPRTPRRYFGPVERGSGSEPDDVAACGAGPGIGDGRIDLVERPTAGDEFPELEPALRAEVGDPGDVAGKNRAAHEGAEDPLARGGEDHRLPGGSLAG